MPLDIVLFIVCVNNLTFYLIMFVDKLVSCIINCNRTSNDLRYVSTQGSCCNGVSSHLGNVCDIFDNSVMCRCMYLLVINFVS